MPISPKQTDPPVAAATGGPPLPDASPPVGSGSDPLSNKPSSSFNFHQILQTLKDFKELIGIAIFFGAGILWVGGYFATKSQLTELRCLTQEQIDLVRSESDFNSVRTDMLSVNLQLDDLTNRKIKNGSLTPIETQQFFDLGARLEDLKKKRFSAQEKADHVRSDLDHNVCTSH
jgi:hypothetical protein